MTPARRFLLVGLLVAAGEVVLAVVAIPTGLGPYLLACAVATAALSCATHRLLVPRHDAPGGDGGVGPQPRDEPPPPPWWPEFEDAFRAHVRERPGERIHG